MNKIDKEFLEQYSDKEFDKPSVTVDAVIFRINDIESKNYRKLPEKKLQVYLTKRTTPPYVDMYGVVGTFIDLQNELTKTMQLCVKNKVNILNYYHEQLYTFGEYSRDPRTRVISVAYMLLTNKNEQLENGEWFDVEIEENNYNLTNYENGYEITKQIEITLKNENLTLNNVIEVKTKKENLTETTNINIVENSLAFDHIKIIYYAIERLKNKLEYTDIIFNMIDNKFTLTELKQCYELILREKLLDANFRRKIAKMVEPTSDFEDAKGHRTSK